LGGRKPDRGNSSRGAGGGAPEPEGGEEVWGRAWEGGGVWDELWKVASVDGGVDWIDERVDGK